MPTINLGRKPRENTAKKGSYQHIYQDKRWKKIRREKVRLNPVCELCELKGITRATQEVHHITPFMSVSDPYQVEKLAFDIDNLQSLCIPCHKFVEKDYKNT